MLSKVLTGLETARARPVVFSAALATRVAETKPAEGANDPADNSAMQLQNRALQERVAQLESALIATKRESFEAGQRQGDQQGQEKGQHDARAEMAPVLERLNTALLQISLLRQEIRLKAEKDVVQLALLIAKRILHRELTVDTSALTALARVVFDRMVRGESLRVTVHPQFADALASALTHSQSGRVRIEPDPGCEPGTLIVRSEEGVLDASIDAQLEEISRGLIDRLSGGRS